MGYDDYLYETADSYSDNLYDWMREDLKDVADYDCPRCKYHANPDDPGCITSIEWNKSTGAICLRFEEKK